MGDGTLCDLLSLPDPVQAKKTQRDKDWPMIRRLLESNYFANLAAPSPEQVTFWSAWIDLQEKAVHCRDTTHPTRNQASPPRRSSH